jgi:hypothetical protein
MAKQGTRLCQQVAIQNGASQYIIRPVGSVAAASGAPVFFPQVGKTGSAVYPAWSNMCDAEIFIGNSLSFFFFAVQMHRPAG